jgi:hypothetical protein
VLWARVVLKQPAGGSREAEAAFAADLHPHFDHLPADTGETALEAAHITVIDDTVADKSKDDRTSTTSSRGSSSGSSRKSTSDPTSRRPRRTLRRDRKKRDADA